MARYPDDEYIWSPETLTLKQIVDRGELPTVVRVSDGIYTTNDSETFSNGDLLKLDFVKTIAKVSARIVRSRCEDTGRFIEEDKYGYLKSKGDILIPLGYNGKVQIARPEGYKRYQNVKQLLEDFPRFVRVDKPITAFTPNNQCITVSSGSRLELKKDFQNNKLLCSYDGEDILLDCRAKGAFVALADDTFYTLQDIVDSFPLPHFIRFVDAEFKKVMTESLDEALENFIQYSGPLQLLYTTQQRVVIGHHKSVTLSKQKSKFCRRALAILPLDNKNVCEIPCQVPIYSENSDEYQLLVARSFDDTNMEALEGGLYLEFAKNPKIHLIESINELLGPSAQQDDAPPPPIPPRNWLDKRGSLPTRTAPLPPSGPSSDTDDDGDVYEISELKSPTSKKEHAFKSSPEVKEKTKGEKNEYATGLVIADLSFKHQPSLREKHLATVPEKIKHQMKEMQKQLVKFVRSKSFLNKDTPPKTIPKTTRKIPKSPGVEPKSPGVEPKSPGDEPKRSIPPINEEDDNNYEETYDYDYPDLSKETLPRPVPAKLSQQETTPNKASGPSFVRVQAQPAHEGQKQYNIKEVKPPGITGHTTRTPPRGFGKTEIPSKRSPIVACIQPHSHNTQPVTKHRQEITTKQVRQENVNKQPSSSFFSKLSVGEVIKLLTSCGLNKMADKCKEQTLDGKILCKFNDKDLVEGFLLSSIKLKKFKLLCKEGWTPKISQKDRNTPTSRPSSFLFSDLSLMEVLFLLRANGLLNMATECERELLDGRFLSICSNEELNKYFSLNSIELKKFELVKKEGYTPRVS